MARPRKKEIVTVVFLERRRGKSRRPKRTVARLELGKRLICKSVGAAVVVLRKELGLPYPRAPYYLVTSYGGGRCRVSLNATLFAGDTLICHQGI